MIKKRHKVIARLNRMLEEQKLRSEVVAFQDEKFHHLENIESLKYSISELQRLNRQDKTIGLDINSADNSSQIEIFPSI